MERFFEKATWVGECLVWRSDLCNPGGYGNFWLDGRTQSAHKVAWQLANGPIPEGMDVLHTCDNRACVNVEHLYLGTDVQNRRDRIMRNRDEYRPQNARTTSLTWELVTAIRTDHAHGFTGADLSLMYDLARSTISRIVNNKVWRVDAVQQYQ